MPAVISKSVLILAGRLGELLDGERAATAIARGVQSDGQLECDLCPLEADLGAGIERPSKLLDEADFDRRMRSARAVVLVCARLDDGALSGSVAFEAATRARQAGVPAYAVTGRDELDPFEARIVDLQVILEASTARALSAAGSKLAGLM
jgi:hypothetical protein